MSEIPNTKFDTPAYVCELDKLRANLELLNSVSKRSKAKILCALKGFAFSPAMPYVEEYLDGFTCSGLHEAKFAKEFNKTGLIHTFSPSFKDSEIDEILEISNHIVFNSANQFNKFKDKALSSGAEIGLRVNPETSFSPVDAYNPCARFSRLGITRANFEGIDLSGVSGLHFHALCEESSQSLGRVLEEFELKFAEFIPKMKWVNFGGGHHITKKGYDVDLLVNLIQNFKERYKVEVYLEPGEAVGWECGYLVGSVQDIVENEKSIAILDISSEVHMPDTVLMPYRPAVRGESKNGKFSYMFGGNTCLAGDIVGLAAKKEEYKFDKELKIGDRVIFEDQIHYTIVKNSTFNGVKLPDLILVDENGEILKHIKFGYEEFRRRN
ncbi:MAG: carboxynorspermidine decarboxylase [Campylobacter sp.]|nr:carboxynorspermidine decarboxylase [Campylobacter sp.]